MPARVQDSSQDVDVYREISRESRRDESRSRHVFDARKARFSSNHVRRCARQLLQNARLRAALDPLLDVPGLRSGMRISTAHKLISLKCDEELARYLEHIMSVWLAILQGLDRSLAKIDSATVKAVELRCPRYSAEDSESILTQLARGEIFGEFSRAERVVIWEQLRGIPCVIPSLFTFLRDVLFFQMWAESMRHIIPAGPGTTHMALQSSRGDEARPDAPVDTRMRRLWINAIRRCRKLSQQPRRSKDRLLAKVPAEKADDVVLAQFATLADQLGFRSLEIDNLRLTDPAREDGSGIDIEHTDSESSLEKLAVAISANVASRCGCPSESTYESDRQLLSVHNLHVAYEQISVRNSQITSFFVLRSQYLAFFGGLEGDDELASTTSCGQQPSIDQSLTDSGELAEPKEQEEDLEDLEEEQQQQEEQEDGDEGEDEGEGDEQYRGQTLLQQIMSLRQDDLETNGSAHDEDEAQTTSWYSEVQSATDEASMIEHQEAVAVADSIGFVEPYQDHGRIRWKQHHQEPKTTDDSSGLRHALREFLRRDRLKSWTVYLDPIPMDRCLAAVMDSGMDIVILLPEGDFEISSQLVVAARELRNRPGG